MRLFLAAFGLLAAAAAFAADEKPKDTPAAAKTRKLLKTKIEADYKDTRFADVMDDVKDQVKGLSIRWDTKAVSNNTAVTYKAKDKQPVEEVLDAIFKKLGYGYYVISKKGDAYDGSVFVRPGKERGYPKDK